MNKKEKTLKEIDTLTKSASHIIYHAKTVFPFDLFQDYITLDTHKLTIVRTDLFSWNEFPVLVDDIKNVQGYHGILFSTLRIEIAGYEQNPPQIEKLWPEDVNRLTKYILALMEARNKGIDLSVLSKKELEDKLHQLGGALEHSVGFMK